MTHSIGTIGGADGPTAILVTGNPLPAIFAVIIAVGFILFILHKFRNKRK